MSTSPTAGGRDAALPLPRLGRDEVMALAGATGMHLYVGIQHADGSFVPTDVAGGLMRRLGIDGPPIVDVVEDRWMSLVDVEDRQRYLDDLSHGVLRGGPATSLYRMRAADGTDLDVFEQIVPMRLLADGSILAVGVAMDVTASQSLLRRAKAIAEGLHLLFWDVVIEPDGRFRPAVGLPGDAGFLGPDDSHFLGGKPPPDVPPDTAWRSRVHPDDLAEWDRAFLPENLRAADMTAVEYRMVGYDGVVRTVREQAFVRQRLADGAVHLEGVVFDVTDAAAVRRRAEEHEQRLSTVVAGANLLVATIAVLPDGRREERFRGPGAGALLGSAAADNDVVGALAAVAHPSDRAEIAAAFARATVDDAPTTCRARVGVAEAGSRQLRCARRIVGGEVLVDCVISDVTEEEHAAQRLAEAYAQAEQRLRTDDLTGVASRTRGMESLYAAIAAPGAGVGVLIVDVDGTGRVNDLHGHVAGDAVLSAVALRIAEVAGGPDGVARLAGDRFLVVLRDCDRETARRAVERMREGATRVCTLTATGSVCVTLSAGHAWSGGRATAAELLAAADRAATAARRRGGDRLVDVEDVAPDELLAGDPAALALARAMSEAVAPSIGESDSHCEVVSRICGEVGERLGLGPVAVARLRIAGLLHDFGKIAIAPEVLAKPGRLDPAERALVERHAALGARMVAGMGGLADAAPAIRHHHERWDGTGYPDGIAGEAIPIEARIIAAVDAWSAMVEPRVYRPALSPEAAAAELRDGAGRQFDPAVVDALVAIIGGDEPARAR